MSSTARVLRATSQPAGPAREQKRCPDAFFLPRRDLGTRARPRPPHRERPGADPLRTAGGNTSVRPSPQLPEERNAGTDASRPLKRHFTKVSEPMRPESCWVCWPPLMSSLLPQKGLSQAGRLWEQAASSPRPPSSVTRNGLPHLPQPGSPCTAAPCPSWGVGATPEFQCPIE